jgi:epoxyqueuosine reductase
LSREDVSFADDGSPATEPATEASPDAPTRASAAVRARARELFDAVAIARADVGLDRDFECYRAFVAAGMQGTMEYLARGADARERLDGEAILAGAKSVVCVALSYRRLDEGSDAPMAKLLARYARGRDYHGFMKKRLRKLADFVRQLGAPDVPVRARALCDTAPVLERAWAARAGLGFIGKNGLVIVPGIGSMVLLGEVVTTLALDADVPKTTRDAVASGAAGERCGTCTRCLDACPTRAFDAPFVLDPRRCVSYLTIEHRGAIPVALREGIGDHVFGCDDCQTVCPFNAGRHAPRDPAFEPLERWSRLDLEALLRIDTASWPTVAEASAVKRATAAGLARNAAIVLGNRRDKSSAPALRDVARDHPSADVREAAAWALERVLVAHPSPR